MAEGERFAIREGGRTVGAGVVGTIIEYYLVLARRVRNDCCSRYGLIDLKANNYLLNYK